MSSVIKHESLWIQEQLDRQNEPNIKQVDQAEKERERLDAIRAEEEEEELDIDESDSIQASDHSFIQIEMDEQDKADNLEPIEISEIEGGAVENEDDNENSDNDSDATDDVSKKINDSRAYQF